mgnify:CR=1 FL=1
MRRALVLVLVVSSLAAAAGCGRPRSRCERVCRRAAESKGLSDRKLPVLTKRVAETTMKEPEHIAKVMRSWMNEER